LSVGDELPSVSKFRSDPSEEAPDEQELVPAACSLVLGGVFKTARNACPIGLPFRSRRSDRIVTTNPASKGGGAVGTKTPLRWLNQVKVPATAGSILIGGLLATVPTSSRVATGVRGCRTYPAAQSWFLSRRDMRTQPGVSNPRFWWGEAPERPIAFPKRFLLAGRLTLLCHEARRAVGISLGHGSAGF
jgi:hypothetical protein